MTKMKRMKISREIWGAFYLQLEPGTKYPISDTAIKEAFNIEARDLRLLNRAGIGPKPQTSKNGKSLYFMQDINDWLIEQENCGKRILPEAFPAFRRTSPVGYLEAVTKKNDEEWLRQKRNK